MSVIFPLWISTLHTESCVLLDSMYLGQQFNYTRPQALPPTMSHVPSALDNKVVVQNEIRYASHNTTLMLRKFFFFWLVLYVYMYNREEVGHTTLAMCEIRVLSL